MAMLIVGGVTVKLANSTDQSNQPAMFGGEDTEMFDGSLRRTARGFKDRMSFTTIPLSASDRATLKPVLQSLGAVTCSGDAIGGSVSMLARLTSERMLNMSGTTMWVLSFTLSEAL